MVTAIDFFCGAGGSSTGLTAAGIEVRGAANHWALAIETHNSNHPETEHYLDDLQQAHPSLYPRADIAWFSPECTNHSLAKGKKRKNLNQLDLWGENKIDPAEERSRATMREVVEFSEYHRYEIVIVENVVDIRYWSYYDQWLQSMINLGYHYRTLYLNAMFFGVPQSRDRWYTVFWKRGNKAPDLDFRPRANCEKHGAIHAVQAWKKPEFPWGRYGANRQYTYRCPQCGSEVYPQTRPAYEVIDWAIPAPTIGERERPLKPKTIQRIKTGLRKFGRNPLLVDLGHTHAAHSGKVSNVQRPLPTQTTRQTLALTSAPFILSYTNSESPPRGVDKKLFAITTGFTQRLVIPPFILSYYGRDNAQSPADSPLPVIPTEKRHSLVIPPFFVQMRKDNAPYLGDQPLATIVAGGMQHYLVSPPWIMAYYGNAPTYAPTNEPMPTQTTVQRHALIQPDSDAVVEACRFRMLEPHELKLGMSFPDKYIILGNKRDQVRQIGNAVACNVAQWIAERCVASLSEGAQR